MKNLRFKLSTILFSVLLVALLVCIEGCSDTKVQPVDSFIRGVVIEKSLDSVLTVVHLPDLLVKDTAIFTIKLKADPSQDRPFNILWSKLDIGSNVAFRRLTETGELMCKLDNICSKTTNDIILLDRPGEFIQMAAIAKKMQKRKLLEEKEEQENLRKFYKQVSAPKE